MTIPVGPLRDQRRHFMTAIAKGGLIFAASVFLIIGGGFLVVPVEWAAVAEIVLPTPMARTDLRATYGGFNVGMGIFLALCALREEWIRPGVLGVALAAAGYGGGRLIGILAEGTASSWMLFFLTVELAITVVSSFVFWRLGRS